MLRELALIVIYSHKHNLNLMRPHAKLETRAPHLQCLIYNTGVFLQYRGAFGPSHSQGSGSFRYPCTLYSYDYCIQFLMNSSIYSAHIGSYLTTRVSHTILTMVLIHKIGESPKISTSCFVGYIPVL